MELDWDTAYKQKGHIFGDNPSPLVEKAVSYSTGKKAFVIGAGYGRNVLYLAKKGFQVTALDPSGYALEDLMEAAKKGGFQITPCQATIQEFDWKDSYDLIVAVSVLHQLTPEELETTLTKAKKHTCPGGINVVSAFSNQVFPEQKNRTSLQQLEQAYSGWTLVHHFTREGKPAVVSPGFPNMVHVAEIIAKKRGKEKIKKANA